MSIRGTRTLIAGLLVVAVVGVLVVLPRSHHRGATILTTAGGPARAANQSIRGVLVTDTTAPPASTGPTVPPPPPTATAPTATPPTGTRVTAPPIKRAEPGTTTVAPTTTALAPSGPATGRLVVTLARSAASGGGPGGGVATMAADGGDRRVVAAGNYFAPQWTPDGRFVILASTDSYDSSTVPSGGGPVTPVPADAVGTLSPDGTKVVHWPVVPGSTAAAAFSIQAVVETATGLVASGPATPLGVSGFSPVWSPDGRRILYAPEIGPMSDLAIVNADGTGRRDLLASAPVKAMRTNPAGFSADGSTISFLGSDSRAYFIDADGQNLRGALPDAVPGVTTLSAFNLAWSADHRLLAVLVGRSIVVVDAFAHLVAVIHLPVQGFPIGIAFDASGQDIYYMGSGGSPPGPPNLYSIALDGSRSQQLFDDGSVLTVPSVLP